MFGTGQLGALSVCVCLQRTVLCYWQTATLHRVGGRWLGKQHTGQGIGWNTGEHRVWESYRTYDDIGMQSAATHATHFITNENNQDVYSQ